MEYFYEYKDGLFEIVKKMSENLHTENPHKIE